jgi:hypothetical protein
VTGATSELHHSTHLLTVLKDASAVFRQNRIVHVKGNFIEEVTGEKAAIVVEGNSREEITSGHKNSHVKKQHNMVADGHWKALSDHSELFLTCHKWYGATDGKIQLISTKCGAQLEIEDSGCVTVTATSTLVLKCGKSTLTITDGEIKIDSGKSTVVLDAKGVTAKGADIQLNPS